MITDTGKRLISLLNDVRDFKKQVDLLSGYEIFKNYGINRDWDVLLARRNSLRVGIAMLSPDERRQITSEYGAQRDELMALMDHLDSTVKDKSEFRKKAEDTAKVTTAFTGTIGGILTVIDILLGDETDV